jgi:hypothetical protein
MVAESRPGYRAAVTVRAETNPSFQAFQVLRIGLTLLPILAGLDKFFYVLADWGKYISPEFAAISPLGVLGTMYIVGVVELAAGLIVAVRPSVGGWLVAGWLALIIVNLLLLGTYWDIALRDFGLMLGAIALARLSVVHEAPVARHRGTRSFAERPRYTPLAE